MSPKTLTPDEQLERLASRVEVGDCWNWTGAVDPRGYGRVSQVTYGASHAHRALYERLVGPLPRGLVLDHLCRNRACCNPDHLEPVTSAVNTRRGYGAGGQWRKTYCRHGHPLTGGNVAIQSDGSRRCLACRRVCR